MARRTGVTARRLRPFFTYFGGKYRAAPHYPAPLHDTVIEPFAGSAGYSLRYPDKRVVLVEKDPVVARLWGWLFRVSEERVRALPLEVTDLREMDLEPEAKALIGFWLNKGASRPCNVPSAWMRKGTHADSFWGPVIRERVASQLAAIRHWTCMEGDYETMPNEEATWFVDPPYVKAGTYYRMGSESIDFGRLGEWCRSRRGHVIVCEAEGADWLPFRSFRRCKASEAKHGGKVSAEVIWTRDDRMVA